MRKKNIFKMDFLSVSFLVIAITLVIVGVTDYISISKFAETSAGNEAKGIAISVANNIDGDKFKKIIETGKSNLYYEEVRVKLNKTLTCCICMCGKGVQFNRLFSILFRSIVENF